MKIPAPFNFKSNFKNLIIKPSLKIGNLKLKIFFPFLAFLFFIFYFSFSPPSSAQTINQNQPTQGSYQSNPYTAPNTTPDVPQNLHTYSQNVLIEVMAAVACQLSGIDPTNLSQKCLGFDTTTGKIGYIDGNGGAIGFMGNMIAMLYTPPTHTGEYIKHLASNFGIAKSAHAVPAEPGGPAESGGPVETGTGFDGLKPLLPLWTVFRNIVYILFVLVFVIIGVAIMLRLKIDPRTVMTIQNQIPKLIIGILLVTFSFSIAGFLIDIMYTSIYLIGGAVESAAPNTLGADNTTMKLIQAENPLDAANHLGNSDGSIAGIGSIAGLADIAATPANTIGKAIRPIFDNKIGKIILGLVGGIIGEKMGKAAANIAGAIGGIIGGAIGIMAGSTAAPGAGTAVGGTAGVGFGSRIGSAIGTLVGVGAGVLAGPALAQFAVTVIAFIIIAIALLWALIRLWFTLITAYIMILLSIVFAPFWIVAGLIPGSKLSFGNWVKDVISNLAAFVAAIVMFELGALFIYSFGATNSAGQFVPPLITNPVSTRNIGAIIGLGIILTTPTVVNMMKAMFGAPKLDISGFGTAMGVGLGIGGIPMKLGQFGFMMSQMQHVPFIKRFTDWRKSDAAKPATTAQTPEKAVGTQH